ncbi:MAG: Tyrosine-specific transport protein [Chlamydiia bacterium]|nr:Tyrosine-specific transport protein [Chlamydiia bacterium]
MLITGTSVGAGMLGIPLVTAGSGFAPAVAISGAVWLFMLLTGLMLLEVSLAMPKGANLLSITEHYLGKVGKWAAGGLFAFLYYFLMVAYLAAGGPLLGEGLGIGQFGVSVGLFSLIFGGIVALSPRWIDRVNLVLVALMFIALFSVIGMGVANIDVGRLGLVRWSPVVFATPILFSAFGYHNMIPSLVTYFDKDVRVLRWSIVIGTSVPLLIYVAWQGLIMGVVPQDVLASTLNEGLPVSSALAEVVGQPFLPLVGSLFAFFAITTSVLGVAFSLVDFLADGLSVRAKGAGRVALTLLTFVPPLLLTLYDPAIFDKALGIAGGIGEALINGLLPVGLCFVARYWRQETGERLVGGEKGLIVFLALMSLAVLGVECFSLLG